MDYVRNDELEEIERLHEKMSYPQIALFLHDVVKHWDKGNNYKFAAKHGLSIHDIKAMRHWLLEEKYCIKPKVKKILRAKIRELLE